MGKTNKLSVLFTKFRVYILLFLCLAFAVSLVRNVLRVNAVKKRIADEENNVKKLQDESKLLEDELKKMQGNEFLESELRDKLGLAKANEAVIVLPDADTLKKLAPQIPDEADVLPDPTWRKWLKVFDINI